MNQQFLYWYLDTCRLLITSIDHVVKSFACTLGQFRFIDNIKLRNILPHLSLNGTYLLPTVSPCISARLGGYLNGYLFILDCGWDNYLFGNNIHNICTGIYVYNYRRYDKYLPESLMLAWRLSCGCLNIGLCKVNGVASAIAWHWNSCSFQQIEYVGHIVSNYSILCSVDHTFNWI